jgi:hypothetical protein
MASRGDSGRGRNQLGRTGTDRPLCARFVVGAAGYLSAGYGNIRLLERSIDHGANKHYRGRYDEAAKGSRI